VSKVITGSPAFVHKSCAHDLHIIHQRLSSLFFQPSSYEDPLEDDYYFVEETVDDVDERM
jgi:hypothetical protein